LVKICFEKLAFYNKGFNKNDSSKFLHKPHEFDKITELVV